MKLLDVKSGTQQLVAPCAGIDRVRLAGDRPSGFPVAAHHLGRFVRYALTFRRLLRNSRPDVAIAYEPEAAAVLLAPRLLPQVRTMRIVHLHEALELDPRRSSVLLYASSKYLLRRLRRAHLVIVPDHHRARLLAEQARLPEAPLAVMNCPPLVRGIPESRLRPYLAQRGIENRRVVHYQGSIGPDHCLEQAIASMPAWPNDAVFVLVGAGRDVYVSKLRALAATHGVSERVIFVGRVPYDQVLSFAVGASVGLTLLEPNCDNWRYAAGASNKRFEYAALGIPQVTNVGPGIDDLFVRPGLGSAVPTGDIPALGNAITRYLSHQELWETTSACARRLHLESYNYEAQFAPVRQRITDWCDGPAYARRSRQRTVTEAAHRLDDAAGKAAAHLSK